MSDAYFDEMFQKIDIAAQKAVELGDKWLAIDCVYGYVEVFPIYDFDKTLSHILQVVEKYPDLDWGGLGPFGSFMETHPIESYTPQLLASLYRQPTTQVLGWLDRTMDVHNNQGLAEINPVKHDAYLRFLQELLYGELANKADENCKEFAAMCIKDFTE